jgi:NAD(P)-dependent dehydrogenase (short-subunit alcohol dehydrogenase family)
VTDLSEEVSAPRALVIGGSRGVGRAAILYLAARGARTAFVYRSDEAAAGRTVDRAGSFGPAPVAIQGDVATDARTGVEQAVTALGGLDMLISTAVPVDLGRIGEINLDIFRRTMDTVVWGWQQTVLAAADGLADSGGAAVVVSSLGAQRYARYYGALGPAKAALETATRYLAVELGPRGVRVNAVSASLIEDGERSPHPDVARFHETTARRTPLRRLVTSADVARAAIGLASPTFAMVTGQVLVIDGGYSLLA